MRYNLTDSIEKARVGDIQAARVLGVQTERWESDVGEETG
jgi:hypothetical protein